MAGTLAYIAPERMRGSKGGPPADWFGWGVTLYVLLEPRRTTHFIETMLAQYEQSGRLPVWELAANETSMPPTSVSPAGSHAAMSLSSFEVTRVPNECPMRSQRRGDGDSSPDSTSVFTTAVDDTTSTLEDMFVDVDVLVNDFDVDGDSVSVVPGCDRCATGSG